MNLSRYATGFCSLIPNTKSILPAEYSDKRLFVLIGFPCLLQAEAGSAQHANVGKHRNPIETVTQFFFQVVRETQALAGSHVDIFGFDR